MSLIPLEEMIDLNCFRHACRHGGFLIVSNNGDDPYVEHLDRFLDDRKNLVKYPGIERVRFGVISMRLVSAGDITAFLSELGFNMRSNPAGVSSDFMSRLPFGFFIAPDGSPCYSIQLDSRYATPAIIGAAVYSTLRKYNIIPEQPAEQGVPRQSIESLSRQA